MYSNIINSNDYRNDEKNTNEHPIKDKLLIRMNVNDASSVKSYRPRTILDHFL